MRIGLFIPCYIDAFFAEVGIATLELLERFGHEVVYPHDQTCCGQPMANSRFNAESTLADGLEILTRLPGWRGTPDFNDSGHNIAIGGSTPLNNRSRRNGH